MSKEDDGELYVYALAEPGLPATLRIRGHRLRTLALGQVDAVFERRPPPFDAQTDALVDQHHVVTALAARCAALLPARFGTRISERALRAVVDAHRSRISDSLASVRGQRQMTVRVFGAPVEPPAILERPSSGTAFLEARRARAHHAPPEAAVIGETLGPIATAEQVVAGEGALRVTVFHLVPASSIDRYRERASSLQSLLAPHRVTVSGPWPPFAFTPELF